MEGNERLRMWFGLSYAGFAVLPRVLMEDMPDEWQGRMAALLEEYDAAFPGLTKEPGFVVRSARQGEMIPVSEHLKNYKHPDVTAIKRLREDE